MPFGFSIGIGMGVTAVLAALGGLVLLTALQTRQKSERPSVFLAPAKGMTFIFDGDALVDATPAGRALLHTVAGTGPAWLQMQAYLAPRFSKITDQLAELPIRGALAVTADAKDGDPLTLRAEQRGGLTYIALGDLDAPKNIAGFDPIVMRAIDDELAFLRQALSHAPVLAWRQNDAGEVVWANAAYLQTASDKLPAGQDLTWPLPQLFDTATAAQHNNHQRHRVETSDEKTHWFEVQVKGEGALQIHFAQPADALVQAESSLREFMQTLTKTFAHLPIGLAIFDRQRQLQLFNPALLDLCGLQPDFLSLRPTLFAFLDAMRERNMIPEPKDYRGWRKQMAELEQAATSGLYEETWNLPNGQTYRVIGRPHPNGAMALMFEDITTEMSRARRFRADLELGQAVVDAMDEAIAVFSPTGSLVMSNAAYAQLWGHDPSTTLAESTVQSLSETWRALSAPTQLWAEAETYVCTVGEKDHRGGEVRLNDGRMIHCLMHHLHGGATMISFRLEMPGAKSAPALKTAQSRKSA